MVRRWMWGAAALTALALLLAACGSDAAGESRGGGTVQDRLDTAVAGLCEAESLARTGDVAGAGRAFDDRAHQFLHELAPEVQQQDPAAAAALLEAKNRVETALREARAGQPDAAALANLLDALNGSLARAAEAVELGAPACEEGS